MSGSLQELEDDLNLRLKDLNSNGIPCVKEQSERYNLAHRFYELWMQKGLNGDEYSIGAAYKKCKVTIVGFDTYYTPSENED